MDETVQRWDARKDGTTDGVRGSAAEEFERAATGGISRQVGQSDDETRENRKEAVRGDIHVLDSIEERMDPSLSRAPSSNQARASRRQPGVRRARSDRGIRERVAVRSSVSTSNR